MLATLAAQRQSAGEPWLRRVTIVGAGTLSAALSTPGFPSPAVRAHIRRDRDAGARRVGAPGPSPGVRRAVD